MKLKGETLRPESPVCGIDSGIGEEKSPLLHDRGCFLRRASARGERRTADALRQAKH